MPKTNISVIRASTKHKAESYGKSGKAGRDSSLPLSGVGGRPEAPSGCPKLWMVPNYPVHTFDKAYKLGTIRGKNN